MKRKGISHFLQVIIMVALVTTLGLMLYSGSLDLMSGWSSSKQVILQSVYRIGDTAYIIIKNTGATEVTITSVNLYSSGNPLGSTSGSVMIEPNKAYEFQVTLDTNYYSPGDLVDIIIKLDDGSVFKFRAVIE